jgi:hypothetical protein
MTVDEIDGTYNTVCAASAMDARRLGFVLAQRGRLRVRGKDRVHFS